MFFQLYNCHYHVLQSQPDEHLLPPDPSDDGDEDSGFNSFNRSALLFGCLASIVLLWCVILGIVCACCYRKKPKPTKHNDETELANKKHKDKHDNNNEKDKQVKRVKSDKIRRKHSRHTSLNDTGK